MTAARRAAAAVLALFAVLTATGLQPPTARAADRADRADRVLVVGVPGLAWDDVGPATPALSGLAAAGGIGALSVRDARSRTCVLDGWLTLGAGNRSSAAADPGPPPADPALSHCGLQERTAATDLADPVAAVAAAADTVGNRSFGAVPGALGHAAGCAAVAGRSAHIRTEVLSPVSDTSACTGPAGSTSSENRARHTRLAGSTSLPLPSREISNCAIAVPCGVTNGISKFQLGAVVSMRGPPAMSTRSGSEATCSNV